MTTDERFFKYANKGQIEDLQAKLAAAESTICCDHLLTIQSLTDHLKAAESTRDAAITALRALLDKLDAIEAHSSYKSLFTMTMIHGGQYSGPNWAEEYKRGREALK